MPNIPVLHDCRINDISFEVKTIVFAFEDDISYHDSIKCFIQPVFSSKERMAEFYEKVGRVTYMIIEGTFVSVLETTKKAN